VRLFGAAEAWREKSGTSMTPDELVGCQTPVAAAGEQTGSEVFTKAWTEGRALTMAQAIRNTTEFYLARDGDSAGHR
jgi:hypothetical protein